MVLPMLELNIPYEKSWKSYDFPMIFLWFSYGFPMPSSQGTGATGKGKTPSSADVAPVGLTVAASAATAKRARKAETVREAEPLKELAVLGGVVGRT